MAYPGVSVGFRFHPTEGELVEHFLHNRVVMGDQFQPFPINNYPDFYGQTEPWKIWDMFGGNSIGEGEPLFFFTHRNKLSPKAKHFDRKVGSGTWSAQSKDHVVAADRVIGVKRVFRYERGSDQLQNGVWLMTEYELISHDHTVLCTLRKSPRPPQVAASPSLNQNVDDKKKMKRKVKFCQDKEDNSLKRKKSIHMPPLVSDVDQSLESVQGGSHDLMASVSQSVPPLVSVVDESLESVQGQSTNNESLESVQGSSHDLMASVSQSVPPLVSVVDESLESVQGGSHDLMASVSQSTYNATQYQFQLDQLQFGSLSPISVEHFNFDDDAFFDFINKNEDLLSQLSPSDISCLD